MANFWQSVTLVSKSLFWCFFFSDTDDDRGRVAAIDYILRNAVAYEVPEATLTNELQQVGEC